MAVDQNEIVCLVAPGHIAVETMLMANGPEPKNRVLAGTLGAPYPGRAFALLAIVILHLYFLIPRRLMTSR